MTAFRRVLQEIERANRRYRLLVAGDRLIVGVSGGPDSTALLALLQALRRKYRLHLTAVHLDHGLQKIPSQRFYRIAKRTALHFGIPFHSKKISVRSLAAKQGRSIEEAGRLARYRYFEEIAKKTRSNKIVTAHTLDDQAETVLMRILRGSGLRGLEAIPAKRAQGRFELLRPLLGVSKKDLLELLSEEGLPYAVDKTNSSVEFTRSRIRRDLMPLLERDYNPKIKRALCQLGAIGASAQGHIELEAAAAYRSCLKQRGRRRASLSIAGLKRLHPAVLAEVLMTALGELQGDLKRLDHEHMGAVIDLLGSSQKRASAHLPGGLVAVKEAHRLDLCRL